MLDHRSQRVDFAEWKCALQPVLPTPVPKTDYSLYRRKVERFFSAFNRLPLSPAFPLNHTSRMEEYDLIVVGSDEVWKLWHPWFGYCPIFYGDGLRAGRLISYAASFGNYDAWAGLEREWADKLMKFEKISVQDENSRQIIKNALGIDPENVLDPCLLNPVNEKDHATLLTVKPYAAVYGHNFSPFFIREVKKWAAQRKITLISIGYRNDWADEQWLTADPFEFASFMAGCSAVATNFFHGCVFALINMKPFACEPSWYRRNKVNGLMKKIDGEHHIINPESKEGITGHLLSEPLSNNILNNISYQRKKSFDYLNLALAPKEMALT